MKILIVEDEHKIATAIKKGLEQEHYAADVAYNGTDGYDLASSGEYDMILLDLMLPGMNGIDVCATLRKNNVHTPVIILTAKGQIRDKVTGLDTGADDYLTKPFSFEELLARIRALSRRPKNTASDVLSYDNLTLNTISYEVTRAGKPITLSSKEFMLLEYFLRHPNQVLSKDHIISHVWTYDSDILANTIEVYLKNLRNKIDKPFPKEKQLLTTVRGFGYRLG